MYLEMVSPKGDHALRYFRNGNIEMLDLKNIPEPPAGHTLSVVQTELAQKLQEHLLSVMESFVDQGMYDTAIAGVVAGLGMRFLAFNNVPLKTTKTIMKSVYKNPRGHVAIPINVNQQQ